MPCLGRDSSGLLVYAEGMESLFLYELDTLSGNKLGGLAVDPRAQTSSPGSHPGPLAETLPISAAAALPFDQFAPRKTVRHCLGPRGSEDVPQAPFPDIAQS